MLLNILDRLLLLGAVLLSTQVPHFMDQYTQRIGGHYETEQAYLERFQGIADEFFSGDLQLMVQEFKASQQGSIVRMGELIEGSIERTAALQQALSVMRGDNFLSKLTYLATTPDRGVVEGTFGDFQPGMPFSLEAILCGVSGGVLSLLLFGASVRLPLLLLRRRRMKALSA
jgi:hypothetical protein